VKAELLRKSILQMAIQGKLVAQDPADESVCELLRKMNIEQSDDESPFALPSKWAWVKLGLICTIARGGSPRPIQSYLTNAANGINWIKIGDTEKDGKYIYSTKEKIKPEGLKKSRFVRSGDFLLTNSMSFGRPYILKIDGCIHDGWLVLSSYQDFFDTDFLYYILSSQFAYSQFCGKVSGAVVQNLNSDKVNASSFPIPPVAEQRRIVARLEELEPLLAEYDKLEREREHQDVTLPERLKKSILQHAIQGRLVKQDEKDEPSREALKLIKSKKVLVSDDEIPFAIPESWEWMRLDEICKSITAGGDKPSDFSKEKTTAKQIPVIANGVTNCGIIGYTSKARVMEKSITVSGRGTIGYACVRNEPYCPVVRLLILVPLQLVDNDFLQYALTALLEIGVGTSIPQLTVPMIAPKPIPLPPLAEQERIVKRIEELFAAVDNLFKPQAA